jgi:hypothetical protein
LDFFGHDVRTSFTKSTDDQNHCPLAIR